jgi:spore maturation protein CgeB
MRHGLNIAFFGSSLVSAYWNGAATYYRGIVRALDERGHRVTFFEPDAFGRQQHRDMEDPGWATVVVYAGEGEAGVMRALDQARGADLVVKASGVGVFDELLEREVLALQRPGTSVVFWDVDAPATLDRVEHDPADPFLALIPRYDLVLTYGGGDPVVNAYERLGARACIPIYNALDPSTHHPVPGDPRFAADLGFLGNRLPDREARVEEFFLRAASLLPEMRFLLGGNGWADKAMPSNVAALGHVYTHEHNAFNCTPRAVLNVNRESMARYGFSPPTRVFEAAGAAACLITDEWEGVEQFLEPDREVLVARDGAAVAEHLRGLTADRARGIGAAAFERVMAEHTYAHRAAQLEALFAARRMTARQESRPQESLPLAAVPDEIVDAAASEAHA